MFGRRSQAARSTRRHDEELRYWRVRILLEYIRLSVDLVIRMIGEALRMWLR